MICPHCGNNNKAGTTFCGKCGEKMPNITDLFSVSDDLPKGSQQSLFANNTNKETNASFKALEQNSNTKNFVNTSNTYSSETYHKTISNSDTTRTKNMSTKIESISKETNNSFIKDSSTSPLADVTSSIVKNTAKINTKSNIKKTDINIKTDIQPEKKKVSRIGYSTVISTQKFITKHKLYNLKIFFISLFVIPLPIVFLIFYSYSTPDFEIADAVKYGLCLSAFFALIYVIVFLKKTYGKPWDGVITYKDSEIREHSNKGHTTTYEVFVLRIRKDSGDSDSIEESSKNSYYYSHFNVGERIRFHPSMDYYEKYDKTNDTELLCPFCSTVTSIERNQCKKCGTPLIK